MLHKVRTSKKIISYFNCIGKLANQRHKTKFVSLKKQLAKIKQVKIKFDRKAINDIISLYVFTSYFKTWFGEQGFAYILLFKKR